MWILKVEIMNESFFSDALLVDTWNWDLSQIIFGQKYSKAAIVILCYLHTHPPTTNFGRDKDRSGTN